MAQDSLEKHEGEAMEENVDDVPDSTDQETAWQAVKAHPMAIFYSLSSCMSAFLWGFDIGVGGITIALPAFKLVFGYFYKGELLIAPYWNALWNCMTTIGMLTGGLASGPVSDRFGRKSAMYLGCLLSTVGVAVQYIAATPAVLMVGKLLNGFALGIFLTTAPTYVSEIAPTSLRAPLVSSVNFFITAGQLTAIGAGGTRFAIITPNAFRLIFALQWVFVGAVFLLALIAPESPLILVKQGKSDQAAKSLRRLRNSNFDVPAAVWELEETVRREQLLASEQRNTTYLQCFHGPAWRRTRIACGMFLMQQFTGIALYAQSLYFLGILGYSPSLTVNLTLSGFGVGMFGTMGSWILMSYIGRRPLLITGVVGNLLLLLAIGGAGCSTTVAARTFVAVGLTFIVQLIYAPTLGAVGWAMSAEVSSVRLRAKTQSLCTVTNAVVSWVFNFIAPYLINTDAANLGAKSAFLWAGLCVVALAWVWFEVPETKDRSFAELDEMFERRLPTRAFRKAEARLAERHSSPGSEL